MRKSTNTKLPVVRRTLRAKKKADDFPIKCISKERMFFWEEEIEKADNYFWNHTSEDTDIKMLHSLLLVEINLPEEYLPNIPDYVWVADIKVYVDEINDSLYFTLIRYEPEEYMPMIIKYDGGRIFINDFHHYMKLVGISDFEGLTDGFDGTASSWRDYFTLDDI